MSIYKKASKYKVSAGLMIGCKQLRNLTQYFGSARAFVQLKLLIQ